MPQKRSPRGELAELVEEFGMPYVLNDLIEIAKFYKQKRGGKGTFWSWVIVHLQDAKTAAEKAEIES